MPRVNNISLIKSFLSSAENHLIINQVNEDIGLFYIHVIQFFALNQRLSVYISEGLNHESSSDLFGEIKIPIIKTTSINKIKDILTQFKRHGEENKNSLSHFGIGMKASLYCKLKKSNNNFGFIISVTETSRGPQPTIIYLKYINNIIKYNSIELPLSLSQKLIEFIDKVPICLANSN